jgi:hypothetical protein
VKDAMQSGRQQRHLTLISMAETRHRTEWHVGMECLSDPNSDVTIEMTDWKNGSVVVDS